MMTPKMTKGYAVVRCENGHDIWGGETEEEARKHINSQCMRMRCYADREENFIHYTPPRVIPPTEADELRTALASSEQLADGLRDDWRRERDRANKADSRAERAEQRIQELEGALREITELWAIQMRVSPSFPVGEAALKRAKNALQGATGGKDNE